MKKFILGVFIFFLSLIFSSSGYFFANNFKKEIIESHSKVLNMATDYFSKIEKDLAIKINIKEEFEKFIN